MIDYKKLLATFPDFPKPGVLFYDLSPLLADPDILQQIAHDFKQKIAHIEFDLIAGVDARGFIFGAILAMQLRKGFVMMRKPGKLPGVAVEVRYALEYGENALGIQQGMIKPGQKVLIIDDVLATGGTAKAATQLVTAVGAEVAALAFILEIQALQARQLFSPPVEALIQL